MRRPLSLLPGHIIILRFTFLNNVVKFIFIPIALVLKVHLLQLFRIEALLGLTHILKLNPLHKLVGMLSVTLDIGQLYLSFKILLFQLLGLLDCA